jgi:hypothetical protein
MNNRNPIQEELKELGSQLPQDAVAMPISVPEGYFEGLADVVLARISMRSDAASEIAEISPLLAGLSRSMPYSVPENFFSELGNTLPAFTAPEEESEILAAAGKDLPYSVPEGYFEGLPAQILASVKPQAKVVRMGVPRWAKMAVAASVAGIMAISGYWYLNSGGNTAAGDPVASELKNVSTSAMEEFIKTTDVTLGSAATAQTQRSKSDVKKLLQDVSDKELDAFLEQVPVDDEDIVFN